MSRIVLSTVLTVSLAGCATGGAIRELGDREKQMFAQLDERLAENDKDVEGAASELGELGAEYAEMEFELELALAKAKLLESMQAPWAPTRDEFAATQRAVVLYHLYELEVAEHKVLEARMLERRAKAHEVYETYRQLHGLLRSAMNNLGIVLEYLNQPKGARIREFAANLLGEVAAFRTRLEASENPRLKELAEDVARYEEAARRAKEEAEQALDAILKARG